MLSLVLPILGMAALDSLNPSAIAVTLLLILRATDHRDHSTHPARLVLPYVAGILLTMLTGGALLLLGLDAALSAVQESISQRTTYAIRLTVGAVLLLIGTLTPTRSRRPPRTNGATTASPVRLLLLGLAVTVVELPTAVPYLAALSLIGSSDLTPIRWVPLLVGYNVVVVLPPLVLLVASRLAGARFQARAHRRSQSLTRSGRGLVLTLAFVVGLYLTADAAYYFDFFGLVDVPQPHPARQG
ncbi:GAP family protein [Kineococcus auxinigenes]|uniref:GAP family protein n=1 Tax=unclassified Kineococcus TaxID=2621656 RepID=UPI003D7D597F